MVFLIAIELNIGLFEQSAWAINKKSADDS